MQLWIDGRNKMHDGNTITRHHHRLAPMMTAEMRVNRRPSGIRTQHRHSAPSSTVTDDDCRDESQSTFIRHTNALSLRRLQVDGLATHRPTTCGLLRSSLRALTVDGLATHRPTTATRQDTGSIALRPTLAASLSHRVPRPPPLYPLAAVAIATAAFRGER